MDHPVEFDAGRNGSRGNGRTAATVPGDGSVEADVTDAPAGEVLDRAREEQLRRLLGRLETGGLDAYEYARRVRALDDAVSADAMVAIVDAPSTEKALDPVDLALLARRASEGQTGMQRRSMWLALVAVFFVVLVGLGMWLVSRAQSMNSSGGGVVVPALSFHAGG